MTSVRFLKRCAYPFMGRSPDGRSNHIAPRNLPTDRSNGGSNDFSMGMDGFAFLDRFRAAPENRNVPVIIWTSKDLAPWEEQLMRENAQAVVRKTSDAAQTLMRALARRAGTAEGE